MMKTEESKSENITPSRVAVKAGDMEPLAVSVTEAGRLLNVSRPTVYALCKAEDGIPSFHIGSRTLIPLDGLKAWIRKQSGNDISV